MGVAVLDRVDKLEDLDVCGTGSIDVLIYSTRLVLLGELKMVFVSPDECVLSPHI